MEGLKSFCEHLQSLRSRANKLAETGLALNVLFAGEQTRLERNDEVSILEGVRRRIVKQLQELKRVEASAGHGQSTANLLLVPLGLLVRAVLSGDNRPSAVKNPVLDDPTGRQRRFGLVMVCIGPNGLPDDAWVASVSQLARESNRTESEVVRRLHENGYLLFSGEVFSSLIDKLVTDVRQGRLRLPVSRKKLADIAGLNKPSSAIRIMPIK
jgi:hypothetical protein